MADIIELRKFSRDTPESAPEYFVLSNQRVVSVRSRPLWSSDVDTSVWNVVVGGGGGGLATTRAGVRAREGVGIGW